MSMTLEEAIKNREEFLRYLEDIRAKVTPSCVEAVRWSVKALKALCPITREQVEKAWRGEWITYLDREHIMPERYYSCSKCGGRGHLSKRNFCDFCGAPMTDEAVDMVMERLEALYDKDM